jgi:hypothetical protein
MCLSTTALAPVSWDASASADPRRPVREMEGGATLVRRLEAGGSPEIREKWGGTSPIWRQRSIIRDGGVH